MNKKIKLIISDLHLGRGKTLEGGLTNYLEEFYFADKFSEFLNYYTSGEYQDYEVELILNGDILNFLQVDFNGHFLTVITESISLHKLRKIVAGHPKFFSALKKFASDPKHIVTYVVGNHDQSMLWPATRTHLNEVVGVSIRYKNIIYYFDGFHVEHGHMHEAANRMNPKKFFLKKDLPEPILNLPFGSHFFVDFVLKVKHKYPYVDKIRPFKRMIIWSMINEPFLTLKGLLGLALYFVRTALVADPRRHWSFHEIFKILLESAVFPDLSEAARKILLGDRVHTVIFGHTHVYQYRQWSDNMEYFNTGTWTELTSLDMPSLGKITRLTYALIEYPSEESSLMLDASGEALASSPRIRPHARLKEWKGYHRIEEDVAI